LANELLPEGPLVVLFREAGSRVMHVQNTGQILEDERSIGFVDKLTHSQPRLASRLFSRR